MIIECERCHTKFKLDEGLLKTAGSKVRCTVCNYKFIVLPPGKGAQIEQGAVEGLEEASGPSEFGGTLIGEVMEEPETIDERFVEEIERELAQEEDKLEPISFEEFAELDSGIIKGKRADTQEIGKATDRAARVEEEIKAEKELERETEEVTEAEEAFKPRPVIRKKRARPRALIAILVIVLVLTGTAYALIKLKPGFLPFLAKKPISSEQAFDMGNRRLSFRDLSGSFVDSEKAGRLFVVNGAVTNNYPDKRSFIRIRSNILDSKGTVVKSKIVFAGNPVDDKEIRTLPTEELDNRLSDKFGRDRMNVNIRPKSSVPFTVVFSDLPEDMSEFTVEAISSSPAGK